MPGAGVGGAHHAKRLLSRGEIWQGTRQRHTVVGCSAARYGCGICQFTSKRPGNVKHHENRNHQEARAEGLDEEEEEDLLEVAEGGDGGDHVEDSQVVEAEESECEGGEDEEVQGYSDTFDDLPMVKRLQLRINDMWPRRFEMGAVELRLLCDLLDQKSHLLSFAYKEGRMELSSLTPAKCKQCAPRKKLFAMGPPRRSARLVSVEEDGEDDKLQGDGNAGEGHGAGEGPVHELDGQGDGQ